MFKIALASLVVCSQMAFALETGGDPALGKDDKKVIELFRMSMMKPNRIDEIIHFMSEHAIESGDKQANLEEVVSKVREEVTGDPFIQNFVSRYENFSDEEIQYLIDVYKSDAMGKLQDLNIVLISDLFGGIQQTIQEAVQQLPEAVPGATSGSAFSGAAGADQASPQEVTGQEGAREAAFKTEIAPRDLVMSITKELFAKEIEQSEIPVVMDCYAKWCPPCKKMNPIIESLSQEWANQIKFVKLDVDSDPAFAKELSIRSMPTFLFFKGGKVVGRHVGSLPKEDFVEKMKKFIF